MVVIDVVANNVVVTDRLTGGVVFVTNMNVVVTDKANQWSGGD